MRMGVVLRLEVFYSLTEAEGVRGCILLESLKAHDFATEYEIFEDGGSYDLRSVSNIDQWP